LTFNGISSVISQQKIELYITLIPVEEEDNYNDELE
jgi:hypothetical protein